MSNPLFDALFGRHLKNPAPFLILPDGNVIGYCAFLDTAARIASSLDELGVKPGDRVAVQAEKAPDFLALYAATTMTGSIFLPLNTAYTAEELAYFLEDSGAKLFVCDGTKLPSLMSVADAARTRIIALSGEGSLVAAAANKRQRSKAVERSEDDLAAILYTSGTTGRSKGAMLSQRNLLSNALTLKVYWQFHDSDVLLHALPVFHTHGLFVATNVTLAAGAAMIFLPKFEPDAVFKHFPQATVMMGVPTFYTRLLGDTRLTRENVGHLRLFVSGSAPLLAETHVDFHARTGHRILERYGMTETNMNTSNPYNGERRPGTVGVPLPGVELKITDPTTGKTLGHSEIGQIEVRGPNVFSGYWKMPEKTADEFRADGFFVTGDLGLIDHKGYVQIVGRNKDLIISGGYNVYPKEIELLLDEQPGVLESAVIGVPHLDLGETVLGVIVPKPNQAPDCTAIMDAVGKSLARFKHPRKLIVVDFLPRNTMGKVQKNILRQQYQSVFL